MKLKELKQRYNQEKEKMSKDTYLADMLMAAKGEKVNPDYVKKVYDNYRQDLLKQIADKQMKRKR